MLIKGAMILDPANELEGIGDILIRNGRIVDCYLYQGLDEEERKKREERETPGAHH